MKTLHCSDKGFDCKAEVQSNTEEEVLRKAAIHALEVRGVTGTPDFSQELKH